MFFRFRKFIFISCIVGFNFIRVSGDINILPEDLVSDLYVKYLEAMIDDEPVSFRRLNSADRAFNIHVEKLKEVNGLKPHNLVIKESIRSENNNYIYIRNPVEAKISKAYLTNEEFKKALEQKVYHIKQDETKNSRTTTIKAKFNINSQYIKSILRKLEDKLYDANKTINKTVEKLKEGSATISKITKTFNISTLTTNDKIKKSTVKSFISESVKEDLPTKIPEITVISTDSKNNNISQKNSISSPDQIHANNSEITRKPNNDGVTKNYTEISSSLLKQEGHDGIENYEHLSSKSTKFSAFESKVRQTKEKVTLNSVFTNVQNTDSKTTDEVKIIVPNKVTSIETIKNVMNEVQTVDNKITVTETTMTTVESKTEKEKLKPKRKLTTADNEILTTVPTITTLPLTTKRKRNRFKIATSTIKSTRRTYGRPHVFMGGTN